MRGLLIAVVAVSALIVPLTFAFAQTANNTGFTNSPHLNSTQNSLPILAKVSDNKHYLVELRWEQAPQSASRDFDLEVYFLNTTDAKAATTTASTTTGGNQSQPLINGGQSQYYTDANGLDRTVPVDTYDIAVYDSSGHVLYQKVNQPSQAGKGAQSVSVGNYTGPVTIQVSNIKSLPGYLPAGVTDSAKFSATVVPEFPVAALMLGAGISAMALIYRFASRRPKRII